MRMKKRVLALILTLSMVFTMLNTAFAASPLDFSDLPADWSRGAVERAIENGLLSGANGKINPTAQLTRAELAAIVVRAFGTSQTADLSGFSDVSQSEWYYDALQKAVAMGILSGNNGRLNPNAPITREEVCVVLYRAFLLQDGGSAAQRFGDVGQISDWAQAAVAAMAAKGCLTGDSQGNVNASKTITRAEFAQMMDNLAKGYPTGAETGGVIEGSAIMRAGQSLSGMTIKGDLILADGLGANDVDLSDCTVEGRIIVRGGSAVTLSGATRTGSVVAAASTVLTNNTGSKLSSVSVEGSNANVTLSGAIGTVDVKADNVTVNAAAGAAIDAVQTAANGTTVQGSGEVAAVHAAPGASNTSVTTNHTDITVEEGAGTVTSNSGSLAAGQSGTTDNKGALQATNANEADTSKPSKDSSDSSSSSDTKRPSRPRPSDTSDMVAVTDESGRTIGSFERGTVLTVDPNNGSHTYAVTVGSGTTIPTPAREGYTFNGWSVSGTNITAQWSKNSTEDPSIIEVRDSENRLIGTYSAGTVLTIDPANEKDEPYTFTVGANNKTIAVPTREGYTFKEWEVSGKTITAQWTKEGVSDTAVYGAVADVVVWNAVDALKNTSYASHTNGKGVSAQTGTDFVWTAAEDGKSIQLLAADGSNPNNDNEWADTETLNSAPSLTFKVNVAVGGIYHLSFFSNSPDTSSDAFHVGVNGIYAYTTKDVISNGSDDYGSAAGERWFVCNLAKLNLNAGENTINIWARESGVLLRQFRLSRQNPIFVKKGWLEVPERVEGLISLTVDHAVEIPFGGNGSAFVSATATNGKAVSYTVVSDHPEIAAASVSGGSVSISAQSYGRAALTVTASADGCEDVIDVISVIVKDETSGTADAGAPVDLMMAPATATKDSITLVWDKPGGRAGNLEDYADVTGYNVYRGNRKIGETGPKVTHFTAEGLNADTEYTFYVTAVRGGSEAKSVTITAKTRRDGGTIDVTRDPYNAKGDGTTKDTIAIQSAIDDCPADGTVLLPAGKTFLTGALDLKSNMTFQIDGTLQASPDVADYTAKPENYPAGHIITDPTNDDGLVLTRYEGWELYCYRSLLNVGHLNLMNRCEVTCENVTISGSGVIKGAPSLSGSMRTYNQGYPAGSYTERRYPEYRSDGSNGRRQRGRLINMRQAKNVNLTGVTLRDGFCWNVHMVYCDTVTTHSVTWDMGGGDNLDGWDPDSTRNGMIFGCDLRTGDDCIAIKSGKNYDGNIVNMPTENIRIFDLEMGGGHGMAIGSEQSGGVENIYIRDLNVHDTSYGFELKANKVRGGYIKNVTLLDCTYNQFLAHSVGYNADGDPAPDLPVFSDITIKNSVIANKSEKAIELIGFRDGDRYAPLENVLFENVVVGLDVDGKNVDKYINIKDAKNIEFKNVTLTSGAPVRLQLSEVEGLTMTNDVPEFTKTIEAEAMNTAAESHDVYRAVYDKDASGEQVMSMVKNTGTDSDTLSAKYVGEAQDGANIIVTYYDETGATYTLFVDDVQVGEPWTSENTKAFMKKAVETDIKTGDVIALKVETTGKSKARVDMIKVGAAPSAENDSTIKFDGTAAPKEIELDAVTAISDLKAQITPTFDGAQQTYTFYKNEEDAKAEQNAISESESIYHGFCLVVTSQDETETSLYKFIVKPTEIDTVALITDNGTLDSEAYTTGTINGDNKAAATDYSIHSGSNTFYVKDATEGDYYQTVKTTDIPAGKYTVTMWSRIHSSRGIADVYLVPESGDPIKLGKADMHGNGPLNTTIAVVSDDGEPVSVPEGSYKLKFVCTASGESLFGKISLYPVGAYDGPATQSAPFMMTRPGIEMDELADVEITVEESTEITPEVTADGDARYQMEVTSDDDDEEIVTVVFNEDNTITLTGVQAGEATITVTLFSDDGEELAAQTFTVTVKDKEISEEDEELTDPVPEGAGKGFNESQNQILPKDSDENQIPEE